MNDIEYSSTLRIDKVKLAIKSITQSLTNTYENFDEKANSLIDLLGIDVQVKKNTIEISSGEKILLNEIKNIYSLIDNFYVNPRQSTVFEISNNSNKIVNLNSLPISAGHIIKVLSGPNKDFKETYVIKNIDYQSMLVNVWNLDTLHEGTYPYISSDGKLTGNIFLAIEGKLEKNYTKQQIKNLRILDSQYPSLRIIIPF